MEIKNLAEVTQDEQVTFFKNIDRLLVDMDGVIWVTFVPIPDAQQCLENFKKVGKSVKFVTNFAMNPRSVIHERLIANSFNAEIEDIINPCVATIEYLKKMKFQKKIFVISTSHYKNELKNAGFNVVEDPPLHIEESLSGVLQNIQDDEEIGAVVFDFDVNLTFLKLQKALTYLKRPDTLFIIGGGDKIYPIGHLGPLLGNYNYHQSLMEISGKTPIQLAKPSDHYNRFIKEKLEITDPQRVLFIGDLINEDMRFAANSGYKKLLVLSGITKLPDLQNWIHPEEYKPDYFIENLTELNKIIESIYKL